MFKLTAAFYEVLAATYTLDYVLKHPNPKWPDTMELPDLWRESILEYLQRIENIERELWKVKVFVDKKENEMVK